jgi:predicted phosphodiesterase
MSVTWLHISDFHFRAGDPYDRDVVLRALVKSVKDFRDQGRKPDLIFATGDVAYSGKSEEYQLATKFFDDLLEAAGLKKKYLFVVPGNHDVDRYRCVGLARTLESREEADAYFGQGALDHLTKAQSGFLGWYNEYFKDVHRLMPRQSTCGPVVQIEVRGFKIGILPINTALFCRDKDDYGKLWVGRRCLEPAIKELTAYKKDFRFALMHHPLDWLNSTESSNIKAKLQGNVDFVLRGHLHLDEIETVASVQGTTTRMAAGASYDTREWPNRALYCSIEGDIAKILPIRYEDSPDEVWTIDPSLFPHDPRHEISFPIPRAPLAAPLREPAAKPDFTLNREELSDNWCRSKVYDSIVSLGNRYTAALNVKLDIAKCFDGLARNVAFRELSSRHFDEFLRALKKAVSSLSQYDLFHDAVQEIENQRLSLEAVAKPLIRVKRAKSRTI